MIHGWWIAYEGERRRKLPGFNQSTLGRHKKMNHVSWAQQEETDIHHKSSKTATLSYLESKVSDSSKNESNCSRSPHKNQLVANETPYQIFEKSISSHAKKVEQNPPESFSDYKISWSNS